MMATVVPSEADPRSAGAVRGCKMKPENCWQRSRAECTRPIAKCSMGLADPDPTKAKIVPIGFKEDLDGSELTPSVGIRIGEDLEDRFHQRPTILQPRRMARARSWRSETDASAHGTTIPHPGLICRNHQAPGWGGRLAGRPLQPADVLVSAVVVTFPLYPPEPLRIQCQGEVRQTGRTRIAQDRLQSSRVPAEGIHALVVLLRTAVGELVTRSAAEIIAPRAASVRISCRRRTRRRRRRPTAGSPFRR